ncbi:GNAT family N-acetyltransferase [Xylanibacillus composti]|nr:GNAT family N-acetyltransferase [Xylanibacillus composti]
MTVQQATIEQLDEIVSLFNDYRIFYEKTSDLEGARAFIKAKFVNQESVIFLAYHAVENQAVGFAQLYPTFSSLSMTKAWILNDLYVASRCRQQGVGRKLLEAARRFAERTEANSLSLSTARDNQTAQRLYESFGFTQEDKFVQYNYDIKLI